MSAALASSGTRPGQSMARFPGTSGKICCAPGRSAARASMMASSSWYSIATFSAASCAASTDAATTSATGSPTCTTRSPASAGRCDITKDLSPRPFSGAAWEVLPMPAFLMSSAINTAITPGAWRASSAFTDRMRACACGERTKVAKATPSFSPSSRKRPRPLTSASSSTRRKGLWSDLASIARLQRAPAIAATSTGSTTGISLFSRSGTLDTKYFLRELRINL